MNDLDLWKHFEWNLEFIKNEVRKHFQGGYDDEMLRSVLMRLIDEENSRRKETAKSTELIAYDAGYSDGWKAAEEYLGV